MWRPLSMTFLFLLLLVSAKKDLYQMFDMTRSSFDKDALKKKMKKILLKYHPDKNKEPGAQEKLLEYKEAYDILEDDRKRAIYDQAGYEAAKNHGEGGGASGHSGFGGFDPNDLFEKFFGRGFGSGGGHHHQQRRTPDSRLELQISLEDAYQGHSHHVQFPRTKLCRKCKGVGAANPKDVTSCSSCAGTGSKTFYRQFGPGMVQQVRTVCDACGGKGKTFKSKCPTCQGSKVERINEELNIKIDPGVLDGHTIKFPKNADEAPDHETGDLYVVLAIEPHSQFRRDGANLYTKLSISLKEAMLGVNRMIKHLDGRTVPVRRKGMVTQPGQVEAIPNEGMPILGAGKRGTLFVEFQVYLPSTVPKDLKAALEHIPTGKDEL